MFQSMIFIYSIGLGNVMAMADRWSGITESFIFLKKEYGYKFNCQDPACSFRQKLNLARAATLVNVSS